MLPWFHSDFKVCTMSRRFYFSLDLWLKDDYFIAVVEELWGAWLCFLCSAGLVDSLHGDAPLCWWVKWCSLVRSWWNPEWLTARQLQGNLTTKRLWALRCRTEAVYWNGPLCLLWRWGSSCSLGVLFVLEFLRICLSRTCIFPRWFLLFCFPGLQ